MVESGAVVQWLSMRAYYNTEVLSSNPIRFTVKAPLVRKAMGNHLIKSTSPEKRQSPVSGFC